MASNLTVLHQYVTSLHRMSTEMMQSVFGRGFFPFQLIDDAAPVPRVHHAFTQMAAMGLWRPPNSPGDPGLDTVEHFEPVYPDHLACVYMIDYMVELSFSILSSVWLILLGHYNRTD